MMWRTLPPCMKPTREANEKAVRTSGSRLRERLARSAEESVVGRDHELDRVVGQLAPDGAVTTFVHGIGGIGKTSFLAALAPRLAAAGARVARLDGRAIEPTPRGFLRALSDALESRGLIEDAEAAAGVVDADTRTTVVVIDEYDRIRLLDPWLRHQLLPALPDRTRWVFAGRFAPRAAWLTTPGWSDAVLSLRLEPLDERSSRALLARRGVADDDMAPILSLARGSPLALELASKRAANPEVGEVADEAVLDILAQRCVEDLPPQLREALDAGSVVRRLTKPLLEAMLGHTVEDELLAELLELSFVERTTDGLVLHEIVRHAVASRLHALDPVRHRQLRTSALFALERELEGAAPTGPDAWRLTADLLFIVDHPEIREAFFPEHESALSVDSALHTDRDAVVAILSRHEPAELLRVFDAWWRHGRAFFEVARDHTGNVLGLSIIGHSSAIPGAIVDVDPLVRAWLADLESRPGRDRGALFSRRVLTLEHGARQSDTLGALWLAAKRAYVERPGQSALYTALPRDSVNHRLLHKLGFRAPGIEHGSEVTMRIEFGAAGIWTWLRGLAHEQLDTHEPSRVAPTPSRAASGWELVEESRGIVLDGREIALSPLEYGVLLELVAARGAVVTRDELLARVWKQRHTGSNVVDALVRLLRKKLGPYATDIETVKGHGFRIAQRNSLERCSGSEPPALARSLRNDGSPIPTRRAISACERSRRRSARSRG